MIPKQMLVTGINGFLGAELGARLADHGYAVLGIQRQKAKKPSVKQIDLTIISEVDLVNTLEGVDTLVHCAARAHLVNDTAADPEAEFRAVNTDVTLKLAKSAVLAGVRRFVYISSIKVHGEYNRGSKAISELDQLEPTDPYGRSKLLAEVGLRNIAEETGLEVVIIRPPLVYGPGVKANLDSLSRWIGKNLPLPLGAVNNRRSMVGLRNLCDFIIACVNHPNAKNETFLVSDGDDISVARLVRGIKKSLKSRSLIVPVPAGLLWFGARLLGKADVAQRLLGDLYVDSSKATKLLNWQPPYTVEQELEYMCSSGPKSIG